MPGKDKAESRLRRAGSSAWGAFSVVVMLPVRGAGFLARQLRGTWRNLGGFWAYLSLDRLLPSGISDTIQEVIELIPQAFGLRGTSRTKQFSSAVILAIFAYLATFLSGGLLIGAAIVITIMVLIAVARNIPAVNKNWKEWTSALGISNDYDVPGWRRD